MAGQRGREEERERKKEEKEEKKPLLASASVPMPKEVASAGTGIERDASRCWAMAKMVMG